MLATLKLNVKYSSWFLAGIEHHIYLDQTSIFWDHVISRVPFHGRKRAGTGKEDGLTFEKSENIGLFSG